MRIRAKLALTVFAAGALTAALVIAAVVYGYVRFERELTFRRATEFLARVARTHERLLDRHVQDPAAVVALMKNLLLYEPGSQLYLLDATGRVLASSSERVAPGARVAIEPVRHAAKGADMPYVMGDDPERGASDAVVAAQPLAAGPAVAGYLYFVCPPRPLPSSAAGAVRLAFALPALWLVVGVVVMTTALAAWGIAAVTRPLRRLTDSVAALSASGLHGPEGPSLPAAIGSAAEGTRDEFGQLAAAFRLLIERLRDQWAALRRLDAFRREAVSNLSHDLRSPLTATAACLETLQARWGDEADPAPATADRRADRELLAVARRNTLNAARLVQSLGDLARLDEPAFRLHPQRVDLRELIDDLQMRFAERAQRAGIVLSVDEDTEPLPVLLDVELCERALANLVDNALKFARPGDRVTLRARATGSTAVQIEVADTGPGIAAEDLPHLFDRYYQARRSAAPATGEGGKGLGLAIVKRIAELHGGGVDVDSCPGTGTRVRLTLPVAGNPG
jgi:signal transduction histidine kinase